MLQCRLDGAYNPVKSMILYILVQIRQVSFTSMKERPRLRAMCQSNTSCFTWIIDKRVHNNNHQSCYVHLYIKKEVTCKMKSYMREQYIGQWSSLMDNPKRVVDVCTK